MAYKDTITSHNSRIQNLIDYFNNASYTIHQGAVRDLFGCAMTYYEAKHSLSFTYSGRGTMYDDDFDESDPLIDCSSMMQAWISGVPYWSSKYYSSSNTPQYDYAVVLPDNPYESSRPGRYYANELAHYFYDKGCCFVPKEDYSDIMPGDVIFMSFDNKTGDNFHEHAFMKIDHCSLVVGFKDPTHLTCLHTTSDQVISFYDIDVKASVADPYSTTQYNDSIVLVARIPFAHTRDVNPDPIASVTEPLTTTSTTSGLLATMSTSGLLGEYGSYTVVAYVENAYDHGDSAVSTNYVGLRAECDGIFDPYTIVSWMYNKSPNDNVYYLHFTLGGGIPPEVLKLYVLNNSVAGHHFKGMYLYEGLVRPTVEF